MNTVYTFDCDDVELTVTFTAPLFLENLDLVSRPVNYLTYQAKSKNGKKHDVDFYFEAGKEWAVNVSSQETESTIEELPDNLVAVTIANVDQAPLNKAGDDVRIDWASSTWRLQMPMPLLFFPMDSLHVSLLPEVSRRPFLGSFAGLTG